MDKLMIVIKELRNELVNLANEKGTLLDSEVIIASKMLDAMLNEYERLLEEKKRNGKGW